MDANDRSDNQGGVELVPASDLVCVPVDWLWPGWLARGKLHLLVGAPAAGKTTIAMALAAAITAGGVFASSNDVAPVGKVLVWSGEDDPADTLLPRLLAMGADPSRILFVTNRTYRHGKKRPFNPAVDMDILREEIAKAGDVALLILDPVVSVVKGDSHKNTEVRRDLQPLVDLAEKTGAAVLGISHFAKGTAGRNPTERVIGSIAFAAAPRIVMVAEMGPEGGLLVMAKNNLAAADGGFAYAIETVELEGLSAAKIVWGSNVRGSARELLGSIETDNQIGPSALSEAGAWLEERLKDGPVNSKQLQADAEAVGIAWRTVERAKDRCGIRAKKTRDGWIWVTEPRPPSPPAETTD